MNYEELIEYLDLEDGSELEYFEAMADMIESEEYIEMEAMYRLFEEADKTMIEELLNDYFEDILDGLPDNSGEIFSLLHQIKLSLTGLIAGAEDDSDLRRFTDEFHKFRNWYSQDSEVELTPDCGGAPLYHSVRDAITASRVEKLGGEKYSYDFENALDYQLDSYTVPFSDLAQAEDENDGTIVFSPEDGEPGDYSDDYMYGASIMTDKARDQKNIIIDDKIFNVFGDDFDRFDFPADIQRVTAGNGGEALLINGSEKTALLDCGMAYCGSRMVENLKSALQNRGRSTLDIVFLSHSHYDHIGALPYVKAAFPDAMVYASRHCSEILKRPNARKLMKELGTTARDLYDPGNTEEIIVDELAADRILADGDTV